jgi:hypothetical protein
LAYSSAGSPNIPNGCSPNQFRNQPPIQPMPDDQGDSRYSHCRSFHQSLKARGHGRSCCLVPTNSVCLHYSLGCDCCRRLQASYAYEIAAVRLARTMAGWDSRRHPFEPCGPSLARALRSCRR